MLAIPGSMIYNKTDPNKNLGYVVASSEYGASVWRVSSYQEKGYLGLEFKCPEGSKDAEIWPINTLVGWYCCDVHALPPAALAVRLDKHQDRLGFKVKHADPKPILQHAALHAFKGITVPNLKKLMQFLEMRFEGDDPVPSLEYDVVKALIGYVFPGISEEEMATILARRRASFKIHFDSALVDVNVEDFRDVLDDDDVDDLVKDTKDYVLKLQKAKKEAAEALGNKKKKAKPKKLKVMGPKDFKSLEASMKFVPTHGTLHQESEWHVRYRATYPKDFPPFSFSRSYAVADNASQKAALRQCLEWLWGAHFDSTGEACPYDLSEAGAK
jgi:hypothetical protein